MRIINSFRDENEEYITLPVIRKFCKDHDLITVENRSELLAQIEDYAEQSLENMATFKTWLSTVLKEGIKHVYLSKFERTNVSDEHHICQHIEQTLDIPRNAYFFDGASTEQLRAKTYSIKTENGTVSSVSFVFTQNLIVGDMFGNIYGRIIYPVFVDVDFSNNYISGRAKSKSNLYTDTNNIGVITPDQATNTEKLISEAISTIARCLNLRLELKDEAIHAYKNAIYRILHDFTFTPQDIQTLIDGQTANLRRFIEEIFPLVNINVTTNLEDALTDLKIFVEKYISINYPDRNIFIRDREAYPIRLAATDTEFTKIDETASNKEPLQCKAKFFDNKKSMLMDQTCDKLILCYNRDRTYFGKEPYTVKIEYKNHYCIFKFDKYVEEEDIQNVLSRIISNRNL